MQTIRKVTLVGAGNVATHLGLALRNADVQVLQVYSRTDASAEKLAQKLGTSWTSNLEDVSAGADLYLFCVADKALEEVLTQFKHKSALVAHTSGSVGMDVFPRNDFAYGGVFYPLQTFSREVALDFSKIPLCVEASDDLFLESLQQLAKTLSSDVRHLDSQQREVLHIAAVFACNFTNHLWAIADEILQKSNISFDVLHPLLEETLRKARTHKPLDVQTGPAVREDQAIMEKHLQKLSLTPDYQKIYTFISQSIINKYK